MRDVRRRRDSGNKGFTPLGHRLCKYAFLAAGSERGGPERCFLRGGIWEGGIYEGDLRGGSKRRTAARSRGRRRRRPGGTPGRWSRSPACPAPAAPRSRLRKLGAACQLLLAIRRLHDPLPGETPSGETPNRQNSGFSLLTQPCAVGRVPSGRCRRTGAKVLYSLVRI